MAYLFFRLRLLCYRLVLRETNRTFEPCRALKYCLVGFIPFGTNMSTMIILKQLGVDTQNAAVTAFFIGGQVSFWSHDRLTFGDRHISLTGWRWRWAKFMPGQLAGFAANYFAVTGLVQLDPRIIVYGFDLSLATVYLSGLVCGVITTFCWTNFFSHKEAEEPATPAPVSVES
jgi:putative flippase GtrA